MISIGFALTTLATRLPSVAAITGAAVAVYVGKPWTVWLTFLVTGFLMNSFAGNPSFKQTPSKDPK